MSEAALRPKPLTLQDAPREAPVPAIERAAMTPMEMLSKAVNDGAAVDVLEKLMALQERWQAYEARRAYDQAMADAKAEIKPINKNRKVGYAAKNEDSGRVDFDHEDMAEIARSINPILSKYGLSYRFRTAQNGNTITVWTIVSHRDGHFEENPLSGPPDTSGKKNAMQAIGSTVTYLQRYGLKAALGLAASKDDDGKAADAPATVTDAQVDELIALADRVGANKAKFCRYYRIESFADILASQFAGAKKALAAKGKQSAAGASDANR